MAIVACPKCRFEFSAAEPLIAAQRCPACGAAFVAGMPAEPASPSEPAGPADPVVSAGPTAAQRVGLTWLVGLVMLADGAVAVGAWTNLAGRPIGSAMLILAAVGHAAGNLAALLRLAATPTAAVRTFRASLLWWVGLGAVGLALGGRPWPEHWTQAPDTMLAALSAAAIVLTLLLTYLRALEWLADRVAPPPAGPRGAIGAIGAKARWLATILLLLNIVLAAWMAVLGYAAFGQHDWSAALPAAGSATALAIYAILAGGGLSHLASRPADVAKSLAQAVPALLVGVTLVMTGRATDRLLADVPAAALAAILLADLLAVWFTHRRLTGRGP